MCFFLWRRVIGARARRTKKIGELKMKKANEIIKDLKNIKGNKFFGYYEVSENKRRSKNLEIGALSIVEALRPYEVDFKKLYKVDFDDVIYNDAQGYYEEIDLDVSSNNSYNWNAQCVFNYNEIEVTEDYGQDKRYIAIKFHRFGDVRGNYTDYMILDLSIDEFYEILLEETRVSTCIKIKNVDYYISTDILKEACVFDIYSSDFDNYDVCLDIYNLRNKKDIKKALKEYLKNN